MEKLNDLQAGHLTAFRHYDKSATIGVDLTLDKTSPGNDDALMLPDPPDRLRGS